jgi:hypothetical protein
LSREKIMNKNSRLKKAKKVLDKKREIKYD